MLSPGSTCVIVAFSCLASTKPLPFVCKSIELNIFNAYSLKACVSRLITGQPSEIGLLMQGTVRLLWTVELGTMSSSLDDCRCRCEGHIAGLQSFGGR